MTINDSEPLDADLVFSRRESTRSSSAWCLVGGLAALGFAVLGLLLALVSQVGQLALHSMTTVPALIGIGAIAASRLMARTPKQVTVGPQGMCVEMDKGHQCYPWERIGWCAVGTSGMTHRRQLTICDTGGKTIATLSDALEDFDTLVEQVQSHIALKGDGTAEIIGKRKGRKSAVITGTIALVLTAVAIANLWMAFEQRRATKLLKEDSVPGEAEIVRRFIAPNGVTRRLEYRVDSPDGQTATRNAEVTPAYWDQLEEATTVPVMYIPHEPAISRLVEGEVESKGMGESPGFMIGLSCALLAMCAVFLATAVMQWLGWDIDLNSKTGRVSIKRFGAGQ